MPSTAPPAQERGDAGARPFPCLLRHPEASCAHVQLCADEAAYMLVAAHKWEAVLLNEKVLASCEAISIEKTK